MLSLTPSTSNVIPVSSSGFKLIHRQPQLLRDIKQAVAAGKRRIMVQAPTSFGKTMVSAAITNGGLSKGHQVLFAVPSINLVDQTASKFWEAGIYHTGIIQSNHPQTDPTAPVQIACTASLMKRKNVPKVKIAMIDEAHIFYAWYAHWMNDPEWQDTIFICWSATPWTKGLAKYFDHLIIASTLKEMIAEGLASDFDAYASKTKPDLSGVDIVTNSFGERDYAKGQLSKIRRDPVLIGDCVKEWFDRAQGEPTMLFAVDRAHARDLQTAFQKAGVKTEYMDKNTSRNDRIKIGQRMANRESTVVAQVATCVYGVDWPFLTCISWNCDTKSEMKFVQGFGRGVRLDKNNPNKRLIFIDHSQTALDLGLPTEIFHSQLCDGTKQSATIRKKEREEREERLPWECPQCGRLNDANVRKCADPGCSYSTAARSKVQYAPGELVGIHGKTQKIIEESTKQRWYSMLLGYAESNKKSEKWVLANYRTKFNSWPSKLAKIPTEPADDVVSWLRHRNIHWTYSRYNPANGRAVA
jgi:DNA repair protein RadD